MKWSGLAGLSVRIVGALVVLAALLVAALVFVLGRATGAPGALVATPAFTALVAAQAGWIVENSRYDPPARMPVFVFVSQRELEYLRTGKTGYLTGQLQRGKGIATLAVATPGVIFLSEQFALPRDRQILLHELVHHFQDQAGREFACIGRAEAEAYRLQREYAVTIGEAPMVPGPLMLSFITTCGN